MENRIKMPFPQIPGAPNEPHSGSPPANTPIDRELGLQSDRNRGNTIPITHRIRATSGLFVDRSGTLGISGVGIASFINILNEGKSSLPRLSPDLVVQSDGSWSLGVVGGASYAGGGIHGTVFPMSRMGVITLHWRLGIYSQHHSIDTRNLYRYFIDF